MRARCPLQNFPLLPLLPLQRVRFEHKCLRVEHKCLCWRVDAGAVVCVGAHLASAWIGGVSSRASVPFVGTCTRAHGAHALRTAVSCRGWRDELCHSDGDRHRPRVAHRLCGLVRGALGKLKR